MSSLPDLNDDAIVDVAREGGFAFIPKLSGPRRIALAQLDGAERDHVCRVLRNALPLGMPPEAGRAGQGDRRYFRVEISYATRQQVAGMVLLIPEEEAPPELVQLWQEGH